MPAAPNERGSGRRARRHCLSHDQAVSLWGCARMRQLPAELMELLHKVTAKRARTLIDHVLAHGHVTTEELKERYGYNHPPRAARDVREHGIPLETFRTTAADGRSIAAYRFGDLEQARTDRPSGRTALSSRVKSALLDKYGARCHIYRRPYTQNTICRSTTGCHSR